MEQIHSEAVVDSDVQEQPRSNLGGATGKGFMPGQSGNPGGRKKGQLSITSHIRAALERADQELAIKLADALIAHAAEGNAAAIKQVMDRIDGPIEQKHDHTFSSLDEHERTARVLAILGQGSTRGTGQSVDDGEEEL